MAERQLGTKLPALVREDSQTRRVCVHEMDLEKRLQVPSTDASAETDELNSERLGVMNGVLRDIYWVNPEAGEPVVYHGSGIESLRRSMGRAGDVIAARWMALMRRGKSLMVHGSLARCCPARAGKSRRGKQVL